MSTLTKLALAAFAGLLLGGGALALGQDGADNGLTTTETTTVEQPGDVSGPCDEAEHANDPRCNGAQGQNASEPVSIISADSRVRPDPAPGPREDRGDEVEASEGSGGELDAGDDGGGGSSGRGGGDDGGGSDDSGSGGTGSRPTTTSQTTTARTMTTPEAGRPGAAPPGAARRVAARRAAAPQDPAAQARAATSPRGPRTTSRPG